MIDQDINNVRARLLTGGDMWWDRESIAGRYIVPKPKPGEQGVSAIYAAGVWLGGFDPGGNLKLACQTYGNLGDDSDFWPGPLNQHGKTDGDNCHYWDRFFEVKATDIYQHWQNLQAANNGNPYTPEEIPPSLRQWPAQGNPYFQGEWSFPLPMTDQGLAPFYDNDGDRNYEPLDGDYPIIGMINCFEQPQIADQMIFWIYNDEGGGAIHNETKGYTIGMEVQALAFSFVTDNQLNDMTFQRHKFINKSVEDIDSFYFALWVDPDLGCPFDDYIGCSPERNMSIVYNEDDKDGYEGQCDGIALYTENIPAVGIDFFRRPKDENGLELSMNSFTYYQTTGHTINGMLGPEIDVHFYQLMTGRWRDGTHLTYGGDGYDPVAATNPINHTNYAFPSEPSDINGWSMCHPGSEFPSGLPNLDRNFIQSFGPMTMQPGAVNELVFGVVYAPDMEYPCPDLSKLFIADDVAQALFDDCFEDYFCGGPAAPDVEWIAMDKEIIGLISNPSAPSSNNENENYEQLVAGHPQGIADSTYNFEGYLVYQLAGPDVAWTELEDPLKARLVFQTDVKNGLGVLTNWEAVPNPTYDPMLGMGNYFYYQPKSIIEGSDAGIKHSFRITEDLFAQGDRRLINHRNYYYLVLAYAANNYQVFNPLTGFGQKQMYIIGHCNIGPNDGMPYKVIPRPIVDQKLQTEYGEGPAVTRLDGVGLGGNFVDMADETIQSILDGNFDGQITYLPGKAPITVKVFDPLHVQDGDFEISFMDEDLSNDTLDEPATWHLRSLKDGTEIAAEKSIEQINEQIFGQYGFSISIEQTLDAGDCENEMAGVLGAELDYLDDDAAPWFMAINRFFQFSAPGTPFNNFFNFLPTDFDNECSIEPLLELGDGYFLPYQYCEYTARPDEYYISPAWKSSLNNAVLEGAAPSQLTNIDLVFTPNKDQWSRCVVVETRNIDFNTFGINESNSIAKAVGSARQFDLRKSPSVGKEDKDGNGLPDPDGDGIGMGWFPGYAIDVETGQRLNVFFGENSAFSSENGFLNSYPNGLPNGGDMLFNPTDQLLLEGVPAYSLMRYYVGGQHFIYITNEPYDGGAFLRNRLNPDVVDPLKVPALRKIVWTSMPLLASGSKMKPLREGLIPSELRVKLRVDNPYQVSVGTGENNGYPKYRFRLEGKQALPILAPGIDSILQKVNTVPNPYYAYSDYERNANENLVKITNLPAKCEVSIYSLDGQLIRGFHRNESPQPSTGGILPSNQIYPDIEWDLKNTTGKPVATGVYLIHIKAPGIGERTLKWVGINRK